MKARACPVCGWIASPKWVAWQILVTLKGLRQLSKPMRFEALVIACAECLPPVVIPETWGRDSVEYEAAVQVVRGAA